MARYTQHIFSKTITRTFYPMDEDQPLQLPTQTATFYLFDAKPTVENGADGTGAIQTGTQSSQNTSSPFEIVYTYPAVDDPEPDSLLLQRRYWEAITFKTQTGSTDITLIRSLILSRPEELDKVPGTTVADLKKMYPSIDAYLSDDELTEFLAIAADEMKEDLRRNNIAYQRTYDLQLLRWALCYKTLELGCFSQMKTPGDKHQERSLHFGGQYRKKMESIVLLYDSSGDGEPDSVVSPSNSYVLMRR